MTRHFGLLCPTNPVHGTLYPLQVATSNGEGWYCAHRDHDGYRDSAASRPFFTTAEAEAASVPAARREQDVAVPSRSLLSASRPSEPSRTA